MFQGARSSMSLRYHSKYLTLPPWSWSQQRTPARPGAKQHARAAPLPRRDKRDQRPRPDVPASVPHSVLKAVNVGEGHAEGLSKAPSQKVQGVALQSPAVGHERLHDVGLFGAGKALEGKIDAEHDKQRKRLAVKDRRRLPTYHRPWLTPLWRRVRRVSLLSQELGCAKIGTCALLPAEHFNLLIDLEVEVSVFVVVVVIV